jgi:Tol biopolymer transport system component
VYGPALSPDGSKVVFSKEFYASAITIMNADGTNVRDVAAGLNGRGVKWSPDGQWLAYEANDCFLFIIRTDGTGNRRLGDGCTHAGFSWSPDGQYIVGNSGGPEQMGIIKISTGETMYLPEKFYGDHTFWRPN